MRHALCLAGVLLVVASASGAEDESRRQRHFDLGYQDAAGFARSGRGELVRAALLGLREPLLEMSPAAQGPRAARLVRALSAAGEVESARALRAELLKQRRQEARIAASQARRQAPAEEARALFASARAAHLDPMMRRSMLANVLALLAQVPAPGPESVFERGAAKLETGDLAGARKDLEAAAPFLPANVQPVYALAKLARAQGDLVASAALLQRGLTQEVAAEGLQLLVQELTELKAAGRAAAAETRAREWLGRARSSEGVECLLAFVARLDEEHGQYQQAFEEYLRAGAAWSAGPAMPEALRLGRKLAAEGGASRKDVLKLVEEIVPADASAPSEQLLFAGDLHREDGNLPRAIAYYAAGTKTQDRARFEAALEALRPSLQAKGQADLVRQVDQALDKPAPEPTQLARNPAPSAAPAAPPSPFTMPAPGVGLDPAQQAAIQKLVEQAPPDAPRTRIGARR